jgi:DNA-binding phage protein
MMTPKHPKITAEKLVEIRALRKTIDHKEKDQIISKAQAAFARHEKIKKTIARLRDARIAKQLTLEQVSALSGIGKANLSRLENEESPNPTIDTVLRISEAIGLEILV